MSLNPITALSEQLQKLINEHGSAAILRDHLALFKDQVALLEKENARLVTENTDLTAKIQVLQAEKETLTAESSQFTKDNEELRSKIQEYENPTEQSTHNNLLEEVRGRILFWLSKNPMTDEQLSNSLQIGLEVAKFHLQELKKMSMVKDGFSRAKLNQILIIWSVDQEGRRYLIENNLIT